MSLGEILQSTKLIDEITLNNVPSNTNDVENFIQPGSQSLLDVSSVPTLDLWHLPILYEYNINTGDRVWAIGFNGKDMYSVHGLVTGLKQVSKSTVVLNTSGKTIIQQAFQDSRTKWLKKVRKGYSALSGSTQIEGKKNLPMLAQKFKPSTNPDGTGLVEKGSTLNPSQYPVAISGKVDGVRVVSRLENGKYVFRSRENTIYPWYDDIRKEVDLFMRYLPPGSDLDGEFVIPGATFNESVSTIRKTVNRPQADLEASVQYQIFDFADSYLQMTLEQRITSIQNAYLAYLSDGNIFKKMLFLTHTPVYNETHLLEMYSQYLAMGFEGMVIRRFASAPSADSYDRSRYTRKKSVSMLKYKEFNDKEVIIVGGEPATGNQQGAVVWFVRDEKGKKFKATPQFPIETRRKWMTNIEKYIGKKVTIRYQELSQHGIPRFPIMTSFRDYE